MRIEHQNRRRHPLLSAGAVLRPQGAEGLPVGEDGTNEGASPMNRGAVRVVAIAVLLVLPLGLGTSAHVRAQDQETSYTSPTYGYQLTWDDTWSVVEQSSEGGYDLLHLSNGVSDVYLEGY